MSKQYNVHLILKAVIMQWKNTTVTVTDKCNNVTIRIQSIILSLDKNTMIICRNTS